MVEWDEHCPTIDSEKQKKLSQEGNKAKSKKRDVRAIEIEHEHSRDWHRRGGAKRIAAEETDQDPEDPVSVRTVQRYIRSKR